MASYNESNKLKDKRATINFKNMAEQHIYEPILYDTKSLGHQAIQKYDRFDATLKRLPNSDGVLDFLIGKKIDIKSNRSDSGIQLDDSTFIELAKTVYHGWLYGNAEYFAFERLFYSDFLIIPAKELRSVVKSVIERVHIKELIRLMLHHKLEFPTLHVDETDTNLLQIRIRIVRLIPKKVLAKEGMVCREPPEKYIKTLPWIDEPKELYKLYTKYEGENQATLMKILWSDIENCPGVVKIPFSIPMRKPPNKNLILSK